MRCDEAAEADGARGEPPERGRIRARRRAARPFWREFGVMSMCLPGEQGALEVGDINRETGAISITKAWKWDNGRLKLGDPKSVRGICTTFVPLETVARLDLDRRALVDRDHRRAVRAHLGGGERGERRGHCGQAAPAARARPRSGAGAPAARCAARLLGEIERVPGGFEAIWMDDRGLVHSRVFGTYDAAVDHIAQMEWAATKSGDPLLLATTHYVKAATLSRVGATKHALRLLTRAMSDIEYMVDDDATAAAVYSILRMLAGTIAAATGDADTARSHPREAEHLARHSAATGSSTTPPSGRRTSICTRCAPRSTSASRARRSRSRRRLGSRRGSRKSGTAISGSTRPGHTCSPVRSTRL
ncbi:MULTISPECIES: site-specific integrase [unclassified Nocardia]|uniref:hypothetical protein n=1 Tax=Nocardia sp. NPDC003254 TaxID=3364299 RepID=UPI0036C0404A